MKHNLGGNLGGNKEESPGTLEIPGLSSAEKERFELSNGFTRYTISSRAPSTKLGDFSMSQALPVNERYSTTVFYFSQEKNYAKNSQKIRQKNRLRTAVSPSAGGKGVWVWGTLAASLQNYGFSVSARASSACSQSLYAWERASLRRWYSLAAAAAFSGTE